MKNLLVLLLTIVLFGCNNTKKKTAERQTPTVNYKLEFLWESDTTLRTPESVLIDREKDILYVACVNENPWEKDGNGFISKLDRSGNIIDLKWVEGLNGPKGMGIKDSSLFVADIDALLEIHLESGEIVQKYQFKEKQDLNDITIAPNGWVYVSASETNTIFKLENDSIKEIFRGQDGERFNGLFWEGERMLLLTSKSSLFKEISWDTMLATVISENMGHGDGIAPVGDGSYITSNWKGAVNVVTEEGEVIELLNTISDEINAADIDFCIDKQILYVPTFFDNRVVAYKLIKN